MKLRLLTAVCLVLSACATYAQGLYVRPTSYEMTVKAGASYTLPLLLRNNQADGENTVGISRVFLVQDLNGFDGVEQDKVTPEQLKNFSSCLSWIRLPSQVDFLLPALAQQSPTIRIDVPSGAHGFYGAVVIVKSQKPRKGPGIAYIFRFVIPILLYVESGIPQKGGQVQDGAAMFVRASMEKPAGTQIDCMVKNTGNAIARYAGKAYIFQSINGRKRRVIIANFDERRIIPNATVALSMISPNRLPSGKYHFEASMTMEGQKLPPFEKDIVVVGDPAVTTAAADVALQLSPDPIEFDAISGSTRGLAFKVLNSGSDPIVVEVSVATPKTMHGLAGPLGNGDDFSLASWCSEPLSGVTINGGQERTLRILAAVPEAQLRQPFYYGELKVVAKSEDGAVVGEGKLLVVGRNKAVAPAPALLADDDLVISSVKPRVYGFTATFTNSGNSVIEPQLEARIADLARVNTVLSLEVSSGAKRVLPFETLRSSGQIDVGLLKDGVYVLEITAKTANIGQTKSAGIRVTTVGKVKKLTLISLPKPTDSSGGNTKVPPAVTGGS